MNKQIKVKDILEIVTLDQEYKKQIDSCIENIKKVNESGYYDSSSLNYIHKMNIKLENILKDYSSWRESVVITEEEAVKL